MCIFREAFGKEWTGFGQEDREAKQGKRKDREAMNTSVLNRAVEAVSRSKNIDPEDL